MGPSGRRRSPRPWWKLGCYWLVGRRQAVTTFAIGCDAPAPHALRLLPFVIVANKLRSGSRSGQGCGRRAAGSRRRCSRSQAPSEESRAVAVSSQPRSWCMLPLPPYPTSALASLYPESHGRPCSCPLLEASRRAYRPSLPTPSACCSIPWPLAGSAATSVKQPCCTAGAGQFTGVQGPPPTQAAPLRFSPFSSH